MDLFNGFSAQGGDSRVREADATSSWANPDVYSLDYIREGGGGFGSSEVMGNAMALNAPAHYDPHGLIEADLEMSTEDFSVCYGMLHRRQVQVTHGDMNKLAGKLAPESSPHSEVSSFAVKRGSDSIALQMEDGLDFGTLARRFIEVHRELQQISPLIQFEGVAVTHGILEILKRAAKQKDARCYVDINIYGPWEHSTKVGDLLTDHKLWLQRPDNFRDNEFPYHNPHMITFPELGDQTGVEEPETVEEPVPEPPREKENLSQVMSDVHNNLTRDRELGMESGGPNVTTELLPHQKRALKYMLERESGEISPEFRLWKEEKRRGGKAIFVHSITKHSATLSDNETPDESGGGVLADEMGTGKSLSALALIARTLESAKAWAHEKQTAEEQDAKIEQYTPATLVIVPLAQLLDNWINEIDIHTGKTLRVAKYHGITRDRTTAFYKDFDVVITTYHTLAKEHEKKESVLARIGWYRIVLDEAHTIRNHTNTFHRSCLFLEARMRWCLTGTPVQNRLEDLGALFSFLRAEPFGKRPVFRQFICQPFELLDQSLARDRLILLYDSLVLRRSKDVLALPEPSEDLKELEFSPDEREQYIRTEQILERRLRYQTHLQQSQMSLQAPDQAGDKKSFGQSETYRALRDDNTSRFSIFHAMMQLRILCNHGTHQNLFNLKNQQKDWDALEVREALAGDGTAGQERLCDGCRSPDPAFGSSKINDFVEACPHALCQDCLKDSSIYSQREGETVKHCPICRDFRTSLDSVSVGARAADADEDIEMNGVNGDGEAPASRNTNYFRGCGTSTKVNCLLEDLKGHPQGTKSIVFSCWTRTLDLIQAHLRDNEIEHLRIDGNSPLSQRQRDIGRFETDATVRVLLMTTGTGAYGLNLTAATRIFIFEPQWNPSVERQAIARAIRIGQEKSVHVTRYVIKNTVEQEILGQQIKKRKAAALGSKVEDGTHGEQQGLTAPHTIEVV